MAKVRAREEYFEILNPGVVEQNRTAVVTISTKIVVIVVAI